jgi:hypothetical protein
MTPNPDVSDTGACLAEPHKRLMAAVLQTVVDDCRGTVYRRGAGYGRPTNISAAQRAMAYMTNTDRVWPFSFENLCDALGMDAGSVRQEFRKDHGREGGTETALAMRKDDAAERILLDTGVQELVDGLDDDRALADTGRHPLDGA